MLTQRNATGYTGSRARGDKELVPNRRRASIGVTRGHASEFGRLLRYYRLASRLSQEALAERAQMSARGIGALERGDRRTPHHETLALLASALALGEPQRREFKEAAARSTLPRCRASVGSRTDGTVFFVAFAPIGEPSLIATMIVANLAAQETMCRLPLLEALVVDLENKTLPRTTYAVRISGQ
jgi:transcriptional regulator with XRE-family HTH domain